MHPANDGSWRCLTSIHTKKADHRGLPFCVLIHYSSKIPLFALEKHSTFHHS